ncbi:MAG: hypothetical protein A2V74_09300 [Acidobacteria bacterium RBG_16_70_10]|nr:MAG: hypothetical protein A2V74_09300 [Acidobacteria bacterium RBG_16_70_10]
MSPGDRRAEDARREAGEGRGEEPAHYGATGLVQLDDERSPVKDQAEEETGDPALRLPPEGRAADQQEHECGERDPERRAEAGAAGARGRPGGLRGADAHQDLERRRW